MANNDSISVDEDARDQRHRGDPVQRHGSRQRHAGRESVSNVTGGNANVASGAVTFTGDADACTPDGGSFDYMVSDGHGETSSAHVTVTIDCVNDAPSAGDDTASGTEDTNVQVPVGDLLTNDSDTEGDTLVVTGVSSPTNGP